MLTYPTRPKRRKKSKKNGVEYNRVPRWWHSAMLGDLDKAEVTLAMVGEERDAAIELLRQVQAGQADNEKIAEFLKKVGVA